MTERVVSAERPRRTAVIGATLLCIGLPPLLVLAGAASHYAENRTSGTIRTSAGQTREYVLHVPPNYDGNRPVPLVISIHGAMNSPAFQMALSNWNVLADEQGFIVVYPAGTGGGPKIWQFEGLDERRRDAPDVVFVSELIDTLERTYNIDRARIYANGLSNGGGATYVLSCTLADRIAAFGPLASAVTESIDWCETPAPVIAFHGTADPFTPYDGAKVWLAPKPFPSIPEWIGGWARRNGCATSPVDSALNAQVTRREYPACAAADTQLYTVKGAGHQWFGGTQGPEWLLGPFTRSVDATRVMWSFFQRHPLRQ
ncbi:MAG TPA: PHB depolymerase family esterase [Vicinamibacterales bacterium]|nr:PHB depolymerase family esterase [Vicinamibacterales bacterium]